MSIREEKKVIAASVMEYLTQVPHPRMDRRKDHPLVDVLVIAPLAVLCGADGFTDMEEFGKLKRDFLATFLDLSKGDSFA